MEEIVTEQLEDKGEEYMTPRKKKSSNHPAADKKCPGCGLTFHSLGRHRRFCTGVINISPDNVDEAITAILEAVTESVTKLRSSMAAVLKERDFYKHERDVLAAWKERVGNLMKGIDIDK